jgi:two-component system OmpR family sensor kinase
VSESNTKDVGIFTSPRSWTLKRRLTVTVAALLALATVLIGLVSVVALRGFLIDRLDLQLQQAIVRSQAAVGGAGGESMPGDRDGGHNRDRDRENTEGALLAPGQQAGTLIAVVDVTGVVTAGLLASNGQVNLIESSDATRLSSQSIGARPKTVNIRSEGDYRVLAVPASTGEKLVIGLPMTEVDAVTARLVLVIVVVSALGLVGAILAGRALVGYALRPLEVVAATASRVSRLPLDTDATALDEVQLPDMDDRTEVGRVGMALNKMLGHIGRALAARQASEDKVRQFVSDASHELRTPLASIRGYAELTRRSGAKLPTDTVHSLARIESEATRMTGLVEDLLLLARLDEGRELDAKPVDLTRIVLDCVSDAHAAGPEHDWKIELSEQPVVVAGDSGRLHQVVVNLLANARVHTPTGTIVTVGLSETATDAQLTVSDNGPGIPATQLPTLFERFSRGDSSRTRATGSTGLGLAIVHAVVTAHRGTVDVTSRKGRTVFTVTLPREPGTR